MTRTVTCSTLDCLNFGDRVEVPSGPEVECGPCGTLLAEAEATEPTTEVLP